MCYRRLILNEIMQIESVALDSQGQCENTRTFNDNTYKKSENETELEKSGFNFPNQTEPLSEDVIHTVADKGRREYGPTWRLSNQGTKTSHLSKNHNQITGFPKNAKF